MSKFPPTIGACIAELAKTQRAIDVIDARRAPLAEREAALREHLITTFKKTDLNGARGAGISLTVIQSPVPVLKDFKAFFKFASKKGNDDLIPRSVATKAWRERVEATGKTVPGVEAFVRVSLRVNKVTGGKK